MYLDDSALLQCRLGFISEVIVIGIVIGIVNPVPLFFPFSQSYPLIFFKRFFVLVNIDHAPTFLFLGMTSSVIISTIQSPTPTMPIKSSMTVIISSTVASAVLMIILLMSALMVLCIVIMRRRRNAKKNDLKEPSSPNRFEIHELLN